MIPPMVAPPPSALRSDAHTSFPPPRPPPPPHANLDPPPHTRPQASRKGWPYYIRLTHAPVYSRATPIGVNLSPCEGQAGHPQGVALLYTLALQATRTPRIIVGPPLAGGLRRSIYDGSTGGANAASRVGPPLAGGLRRP